MDSDHWEWKTGKVSIDQRYFELKYGYNPSPVARIGIGTDNIFIVEFLQPPNTNTEKLKEIIKELIWEIELYLVNNKDPITYIINHTKKCANIHSRVHWNYKPRGAQRRISLSKKSDWKNPVTRFFSFITK